MEQSVRAASCWTLPDCHRRSEEQFRSEWTFDRRHTHSSVFLIRLDFQYDIPCYVPIYLKLTITTLAYIWNSRSSPRPTFETHNHFPDLHLKLAIRGVADIISREGKFPFPFPKRGSGVLPRNLWNSVLL